MLCILAQGRYLAHVVWPARQIDTFVIEKKKNITHTYYDKLTEFVRDDTMLFGIHEHTCSGIDNEHTVCLVSKENRATDLKQCTVRTSRDE